MWRFSAFSYDYTNHLNNNWFNSQWENLFLKYDYTYPLHLKHCYIKSNKDGAQAWIVYNCTTKNSFEQQFLHLKKAELFKHFTCK